MNYLPIFLCCALLVSAASSASGADARISFEKQIKPIFERSCVQCHGKKKQEGDFRIDRKKDAMKRGEHGVVIVPGKGSESRLVRLISLPEDDLDLMPARGDLLTTDEIELIRKWIDHGAVWGR